MESAWKYNELFVTATIVVVFRSNALAIIKINALAISITGRETVIWAIFGFFMKGLSREKKDKTHVSESIPNQNGP